MAVCFAEREFGVSVLIPKIICESLNVGEELSAPKVLSYRTGLGHHLEGTTMQGRTCLHGLRHPASLRLMHKTFLY